MELIDVVTPDGLPTGRSKPKPAIHRDGDWHRTAHVWFVTPGGQILLQQRSVTKESYPGLWDVSSAGHVSAGESVVQAAVREVAEELGVELSAGELHEIGSVRESAVLNDGAYRDNEIHTIFVVHREVEIPSLHVDAQEVAAVELVTLEELAAKIRAGDRELVPHPDEYPLLLAHLGVPLEEE